MNQFIKPEQISPACDLSRKAEDVARAVRMLAEEARSAGLLDQAQSLDLAADDCGRVGLEFGVAVHMSFCSTRGEEIPS